MKCGIPTTRQFPIDLDNHVRIESRCPRRGKQMFVVEEYRVFLENKTGFSKRKINRICYAAESLLNDFTKLLLMLIVGLCTGKVLLFVSIFLPYSVLRPFLGGLHSNSNGPVSSPKKKRLNKKNGRLSQLDNLSTAWNFIKLWGAEDEISGN